MRNPYRCSERELEIAQLHKEQSRLVAARLKNQGNGPSRGSEFAALARIIARPLKVVVMARRTMLRISAQPHRVAVD